MNSHDLSRMNNHDYLYKNKNLNLLWSILIIGAVLLLIHLFK